MMQMRATLESFISRAAGPRARVGNLRLLAGGSSQEAWSLDAVIAGGVWAGTHALVLRRELGGAINPLALSRAAEFHAYPVRHRAGVAVPRPYWLADGEERIAGSAAFLMERVAGEAIG